MDTKDLMTYLLTPVAQVALIIGLAEVAKKMGLETRWIPLLDIILGLASGLAVYGVTMEYGILQGIVMGLALGLSACGLFSGIKNTIAKEEIDDGISANNEV